MRILKLIRAGGECMIQCLILIDYYNNLEYGTSISLHDIAFHWYDMVGII